MIPSAIWKDFFRGLWRPLSALLIIAVVFSASAAFSDPPEQEVRQAIAGGVKAFEAEDLPRLMAMVSESYRSGPITKEGIRLQLLGIFHANREIRVTLKIHEVTVRGELAYVRSSGEVTGRPLFWLYRVVILEWQDLVEVGRQEGRVWRLYGDQQ